MNERRRVVDGRGRPWTFSKISWKEEEEEDFRFWYEQLTSEERVEAVVVDPESCLKARGLDALPRLRRVHRRIRALWAKPVQLRRPPDKVTRKRGTAVPRRFGEP
jgi:hypothetical protein